MPKIAATIQELVLAYLTQANDQLETDGSLAEQDVMLPQAADLLSDFATFAYAYFDCESAIVSTDMDESVEQQITDLSNEAVQDLAAYNDDSEEEGDYAAHEYLA